MANKLTLNLKSEKFMDLVDKLQDLTSISDTIKLKIDEFNILAYSMLSNDVSVLSLKNYLLSTKEYIDDFKSDKTFDFIITSAAKFVKNLKFFNAYIPIKLELNSRPTPDNEDVMHVRSSICSNGRLKISCVGGELSKIRDINKDALDSRLNIKNSKWGFKVLKCDFQDIKKLSNINSDEKIVNIIVESGKVSIMEEYKWELYVDNIDVTKTTKLTFNKKYLSNINEYDYIEFLIFETFILIKDDISNLMISFETDFQDQD